MGYWHWIRWQIIIKLYGIINGEHLEETHHLGYPGQEDDKP